MEETNLIKFDISNSVKKFVSLLFIFDLFIFWFLILALGRSWEGVELLRTLWICPIKTHWFVRFRQWVVIIFGLSRLSNVGNYKGCLLLHYWEKVAFNDWVHVDLARQVLLQLKLVADPQQFVLLLAQDVLDNIEQFSLPKMHKSIQHFQRVFIRYHIREEAQEGVRKQGLQDYLARLKVNIEQALFLRQPALNFFHKRVELFHSIGVHESPLWNFCEAVCRLVGLWH